MSLSDRDPLRARLHEVEDEIRERVKHVCKTPAPRDLDTGAMIRFEEELSIVASAAKEAVSLRRRLRTESDEYDALRTDDRRGRDLEPRGRDPESPGESGLAAPI